MRKPLKSLLNEAHDEASQSESIVAQYIFNLLRDVQEAFAADAEINLLSKLPSDYSANLSRLSQRAAEDPAFHDAQRQADDNFKHLLRTRPPSPSSRQPWMTWRSNPADMIECMLEEDGHRMWGYVI